MQHRQTYAELGIETRHSFERGDRHLAYRITPPDGVLDDAGRRTDYLHGVLAAILADKEKHLYAEQIYIEVEGDGERFQRLAEGFIFESRRVVRQRNRFRFYWERRGLPAFLLLAFLFFANQHYHLGGAPEESIRDLADQNTDLVGGMAYVIGSMKFYAGLVLIAALKALFIAGIGYGLGRLYARWRYPEAGQALDFSGLLAAVRGIPVGRAEAAADESEVYNDPF